MYNIYTNVRSCSSLCSWIIILFTKLCQYTCARSTCMPTAWIQHDYALIHNFSFITTRRMLQCAACCATYEFSMHATICKIVCAWHEEYSLLGSKYYKIILTVAFSDPVGQFRICVLSVSTSMKVPIGYVVPFSLAWIKNPRKPSSLLRDCRVTVLKSKNEF